MLKITIDIPGDKINLPDLNPGESGSLMNYLNSSLLIFKCNDADDGASVYESLHTCHIGKPDKREIIAGKLNKLANINADCVYFAKIKTDSGQGSVKFVHVNSEPSGKIQEGSGKIL